MAEKKYYVDLRWTNPGPAKYLIDSWQKDSFMEAFHFAKQQAEKLDDEHFIEIREVDSGETVTSFNTNNLK